VAVCSQNGGTVLSLSRILWEAKPAFLLRPVVKERHSTAAAILRVISALGNNSHYIVHSTYSVVSDVRGELIVKSK
jgi:hypothetical protein